MLFAQFYQMSTGYIPGTIPPQFGEPKLIEATGDRSVIVLDGRILESFNLNIARQECKKRGYVAYALFKGETFCRSKRVTDIKDNI